MQKKKISYKKSSVSHPNKRSGYMKEWSESIKELKTSKALIVAGFDISFYLLLLLLMLASKLAVSWISKSLLGYGIAGTSAMVSAQVVAANPGIYSSVYGLVVAILGLMAFLVVAMILGFIFSRYLIWTTLLGRKLKNRVFWKFAGLNIIWVLIAFIAFTIPMLILSLLSNQVLLMITTFIVYFTYLVALFYYTYSLYYRFIISEKVFSSLLRTFTHGSEDILRLWPNILVVALTALAITIASFLFKLLPGPVESVFTGIVFIVMATWIKLYISSVLSKNVRAEQ